MPGAELRADFWLSEFITPWDVYHHGVTRVLAHAITPYQEMYIIETGVYGKALVLDGKWQSSTGDEFLYHEALVQPAMIAHGAPRKVLILGGGEGATAREALRWKTVEEVVMVDIDGDVVEACREHLAEMHQGAFDDSRLRLIIGDALEFLDSAQAEWDVVISDLSDPIEHGPSYKLFTRETFERVGRVLAAGGFFVLQAGPVSPAEITIHARLVKTLGTLFPDVRPFASFIPTYGCPWGFALCSKRSGAPTLDPQSVDALLTMQTTGGLKFIDGITLAGLHCVPKHVRRAIDEATRIYTLADPPEFHGAGVFENRAAR